MSDIKYPKAIKTLSALAEGVDPETGELLAEGHVFHQPDVIRSLFAAIQSLKTSHRRQRKRQALPARAGRPWTEKESSELLKRHQGGKSIKLIAEKHKRTTGAIQSQLIRLGLLHNIL